MIYILKSFNIDIRCSPATLPMRSSAKGRFFPAAVDHDGWTHRGRHNRTASLIMVRPLKCLGRHEAAFLKADVYYNVLQCFYRNEYDVRSNICIGFDSVFYDHCMLVDRMYGQNFKNGLTCICITTNQNGFSISPQFRKRAMSNTVPKTKHKTQ